MLAGAQEGGFSDQEILDGITSVMFAVIQRKMIIDTRMLMYLNSIFMRIVSGPRYHDI